MPNAQCRMPKAQRDPTAVAATKSQTFLELTNHGDTEGTEAVKVYLRVFVPPWPVTCLAHSRSFFGIPSRRKVVHVARAISRRTALLGFPVLAGALASKTADAQSLAGRKVDADYKEDLFYR